MKTTHGQVAEVQDPLKGSVLAEMTPAQAEQWVEEQVNDVASAKRALMVLAHAVVALAKRGED